MDAVEFERFAVGRLAALVRFGRMISADSADAEDLVQSALANAFRHRHRLDAGGIESYVRRSILNAQMTRRSRILPVLVHGDLGGENVHWDESGNLVGVLDWDRAQPFDHAVDVACLAWHGWRNVQAAVDAATYQRARVWSRTFAIEGIVAALTNGEPEHMVARFVASAARALETDEFDE